MFRSLYKGLAAAAVVVNGPPPGGTRFRLALKRPLTSGQVLTAGAVVCEALNGTQDTVDLYTDEEYSAISCAGWYHEGIYYAAVVNSANDTALPTAVSFQLFVGGSAGPHAQPQTLCVSRWCKGVALSLIHI